MIDIYMLDCTILSTLLSAAITLLVVNIVMIAIVVVKGVK